MKRNIRLLLIFVTAYATNVVMAKAQFAPETIKQLVETSSDSYCYSTPPLKSTYQVAQDVLADGSLEILFKYYSLEDIFSWNNGKLFFQEIQYYCDSTAKNQLMPYLKEYAQKQLQKIFIADVINLPTPTAFHAHNDYETTAQVASDLNTNQSYKQHIKELAPLLCSIIKEEKELNDKGYIVLFHGQRWEYLFGEKLYTDLWALTHHKKRPTNYLFAHVRMKGHDPVEEYGPQQRFKLLHTGWHYYNFMLWTCNSLFSNYKVADYSSPLSYFLKNDNYGRVTFCLQEIFDYYKLSHLYQKHAKDIAELEKLYNAARTLGTMALSSITTQNSLLFMTVLFLSESMNASVSL